MTELDNYLPRTKADLQLKARLPKATGHAFISLLRHSPCSLRHRCGGSQPYSSNLYPPPGRGVRFGAQWSDTERQGPLRALDVSVTGGGCCYWLILRVGQENHKIWLQPAWVITTPSEMSQVLRALPFPPGSPRNSFQSYAGGTAHAFGVLFIGHGLQHPGTGIAALTAGVNLADRANTTHTCWTPVTALPKILSPAAAEPQRAAQPGSPARSSPFPRRWGLTPAGGKCPDQPRTEQRSQTLLLPVNREWN